MTVKSKKLDLKKTVQISIGGENITDPDIKAIILISEAMRISTPRMREENLRFVLNSPKYNIEVTGLIKRKP